MMEKRNLLANYMELDQQQAEQQEESEVPKEEAEKKSTQINATKKQKRNIEGGAGTVEKRITSKGIVRTLNASTVTNQATLKKSAGNGR